MTERVQVLELLLDITRRGVRFYEQAAAKTADRALAAGFTRLARAKLTLLENFGSESEAPEGTGAFSTPGSLADGFRAFYEGIRSRATAGEASALTELVDREQRLHDALQKEALADGKPLSTRAAAALTLPPLAGAIEALRPVAIEEQPALESVPLRKSSAA